MENKPKNTEFKTLMDYAKKMHRRYFHALSAFYAYEALREVIGTNIVGQSEAEENAKTIGRYNNFFGPAQEALRVYFFLELAKMFDSSKKVRILTKRHRRQHFLSRTDSPSILSIFFKRQISLGIEQVSRIRTIPNPNSASLDTLKDTKPVLWQ